MALTYMAIMKFTWKEICWFWPIWPSWISFEDHDADTDWNHKILFRVKSMIWWSHGHSKKKNRVKLLTMSKLYPLWFTVILLIVSKITHVLFFRVRQNYHISRRVKSIMVIWVRNIKFALKWNPWWSKSSNSSLSEIHHTYSHMGWNHHIFGRVKSIMVKIGQNHQISHRVKFIMVIWIKIIIFLLECNQRWWKMVKTIKFLFRWKPLKSYGKPL